MPGATLCVTCILPKRLVSPAAQDGHVCLLPSASCRTLSGNFAPGTQSPAEAWGWGRAQGAWGPLGWWGTAARLGFLRWLREDRGRGRGARLPDVSGGAAAGPAGIGSGPPCPVPDAVGGHDEGSSCARTLERGLGATGVPEELCPPPPTLRLTSLLFRFSLRYL